MFAVIVNDFQPSLSQKLKSRTIEDGFFRPERLLSLRPSSPFRNFTNHHRQVYCFTVPSPSILHIFLLAAAAECPHLNSYNIKLRFRSFSM
jgi:hypothetical protein